jgi:PAS domain S-box-containing protein
MTRYPGTATTTFLWITLLLLFLLGSALAYYNAVQQVEADRLVSHSHRVLHDLDGLLTLLVDAETGQRGFLITDEANYLKPYREALEQLAALQKSLRQRIGQDATAQTCLDQLDEHIEAKLKELDGTIGQHQRALDEQARLRADPGGWLGRLLARVRRARDFEAVRAVVRTDHGKKEMDAIRATIRELRQSQESLLETRAAEAGARFQISLLSLLLTGTACLGLLFAVYSVTGRYTALRERALEIVAQEHERLRVTLASIGDAVIVTDSAGRITFLNPVAEQLTGWNANAIGRPLSEVFHIVNEETGTAVESPVQKVLREGMVVGLANHTELIAQDGTRRPIDDSGAPIRDRAGDIAGVVLVFRDITQRREAERAIEESHRFLVSSLDALTKQIAVLDETGTILLVNAAWSTVADTQAERGIDLRVGADYLAACARGGHGDTATGARLAAGLRELLDGRATHFETEYAVEGPTGCRWYLLRSSRFEFAGRCRLVVSHEEFTARRRAEEGQARLIEELREADRRKDEFLAMLGHELRNPLAPVQNALLIIRDLPASDPVLVTTADMISRQVAHMVRLVDDLLDVSRLTSGKIELRKETEDLVTLVNRAIEMTRPFLEQRQHTLHLVLPAHPVIVEGDGVRLTQVVTNLLNNAAKFTAEGGTIWLSVEKNETSAQVRVRDNGSGINSRMLPRVFDVFVQGERALDRAQGGLGIGLTLVRRLVELHGGSVEARSEGLGRGSEFIVTLPLARSLPAPVPAAPQASIGLHWQGLASEASASPRRRVLVVDDHRDAADSLQMLLTLLGHEVAVAYNGPDALEKLADWKPEVIFLDLGLPGMTGYDVVQRIRNQPGLHDVFVVALTGYGTEQDRRRTAEAGFDQHLVKPPELTALRAVLARPHRNGGDRGASVP